MNSISSCCSTSIPPEELRGATITLSNFGMIGGRFANLIVVPQQVAIVGAGRIGQRCGGESGTAGRTPRFAPLAHFRPPRGDRREAAGFLVALRLDLERSL
jgi:2-oxoisovalerate dehydrogenase E2 component (dihydrolipoyl transacylase)